MAQNLPVSGRKLIAERIAAEFKSGDVVNLGIGLPTTVANYLPPGVDILLQSENGFIGLGPTPGEGEEDADITNAGGQPASIIAGGAFFDSAMSFAIIRGGHVDATVLGTLEVDGYGNIANYIIPGKMVPGMGGAMDLCCGARKVIIATDHLDKNGRPKILQQCRLPLTARGEADMIVTDMAVLKRCEHGLMLTETAPGVSVEQVIDNTEADLIISDNVATMLA